MTESRAALAARFEAAGFEPAAADGRAALLAGVEAALQRTTGAAPVWRWFVPGRIEVFGKHTDYAGGRSLLVAVPRGFAVAASPRDDDRVRVVDAGLGERIELSARAGVVPAAGWPAYAGVVLRRLALNFPGAPFGTDIALGSDLPPAAGLSSSSALVVALASALARRAALETRVEWREAIRSAEDLAGYLGAVENGLAFGPLAGQGGVGTFGGSEDHTAILACRPGRVSAFAYVPVRPVAEAPVPAAWTFCVASSGVAAEKAGGARERYNRASLATRALLDAWRAESADDHPTLAAALASSRDAGDRLREALRRRSHAGFGPGELLRRLAHFEAEDARVVPAAEAFRAADAGALGALAEASQADAERLLGNQVDETMALASLARREGALAASSFGAGFGGSVWAVVAAADAAAFGARWAAGYAARFPGRRGAWFAARPGPGLVALDPVSG